VFLFLGYVQIQQNLLDVEQEVTEEGIRLAGKKGTALVIMEPLRGGGLASAPGPVGELYGSYAEKRQPVEWAFRHLINYPEVSCILSGMTTMQQLKENIELFSKPDFVPGSLSMESWRSSERPNPLMNPLQPSAVQAANIACLAPTASISPIYFPS
jgi:predicted aldo/keto reductase-like oxidoreductase